MSAPQGSVRGGTVIEIARRDGGQPMATALISPLSSARD